MKKQHEELWAQPPIGLSAMRLTNGTGHGAQRCSRGRAGAPPFRPAKGQRGGDHFSACRRNSGPSTLVLGLRLCFLSCARPPNICHLFFR